MAAETQAEKALKRELSCQLNQADSAGEGKKAKGKSKKAKGKNPSAVPLC
jgi:hypothetical protein